MPQKNLINEKISKFTRKPKSATLKTAINQIVFLLLSSVSKCNKSPLHNLTISSEIKENYKSSLEILRYNEKKAET